MVEYQINDKTVTSPQWWYDYWINPYKCIHKKNRTGLCRHEDCPKKSYSYSFSMAWWSNKETCNKREKKIDETD